jgi:hypothetical protein
MDSNELAAAVQAGLSPSEIVGAIIARGDADAAAAYRKA